MSTTTDPVLAALDAHVASAAIDRSAAGWRTRLAAPPSLPFGKSSAYRWVLRTNHGELRIDLLSDVAPKHVASTMYLTRLGFYDGLTFHRVIEGFMAQGGCPLGTGTGGPGYRMDGEFDRTVRHDRRGLLSMANAGPGTDGSQFFITFGPTPHLDGKHTIFGRLAAGEQVLDALEAKGSRSGTPKERLVIDSADIVAA